MGRPTLRKQMGSPAELCALVGVLVHTLGTRLRRGAHCLGCARVPEACVQWCGVSLWGIPSLCSFVQSVFAVALPTQRMVLVLPA